jgi:hypothetical protein
MLSTMRRLPRPAKLRFASVATSQAKARLLSENAKPRSDIYPFDLFDVRDKIIVTTGGARGLGFDMAHQLSEAGAKGTVSFSRVVNILLNFFSICPRHSRKTS